MITLAKNPDTCMSTPPSSELKEGKMVSAAVISSVICAIATTALVAVGVALSFGIMIPIAVTVSAVIFCSMSAISTSVLVALAVKRVLSSSKVCSGNLEQLSATNSNEVVESTPQKEIETIFRKYLMDLGVTEVVFANREMVFYFGDSSRKVSFCINRQKWLKQEVVSHDVVSQLDFLRQLYNQMCIIHSPKIDDGKDSVDKSVFFLKGSFSCKKTFEKELSKNPVRIEEVMLLAEISGNHRINGSFLFAQSPNINFENIFDLSKKPRYSSFGKELLEYETRPENVCSRKNHTILKWPKGLKGMIQLVMDRNRMEKTIIHQKEMDAFESKFAEKPLVIWTPKIKEIQKQLFSRYQVSGIKEGKFNQRQKEMMFYQGASGIAALVAVMVASQGFSFFVASYLLLVAWELDNKGSIFIKEQAESEAEEKLHIYSIQRALDRGPNKEMTINEFTKEVKELSSLIGRNYLEHLGFDLEAHFEICKFLALQYKYSVLTQIQNFKESKIHAGIMAEEYQRYLQEELGGKVSPDQWMEPFDQREKQLYLENTVFNEITTEKIEGICVGNLESENMVDRVKAFATQLHQSLRYVYEEIGIDDFKLTKEMLLQDVVLKKKQQKETWENVLDKLGFKNSNGFFRVDKKTLKDGFNEFVFGLAQYISDNFTTLKAKGEIADYFTKLFKNTMLEGFLENDQSKTMEYFKFSGAFQSLMKKEKSYSFLSVIQERQEQFIENTCSLLKTFTHDKPDESGVGKEVSSCFLDYYRDLTLPSILLLKERVKNLSLGVESEKGAAPVQTGSMTVSDDFFEDLPLPPTFAPTL